MGPGMTAWEYLELMRRFRWTPTQVDEMPAWLVRHALAFGP
jgi:hypothetical protein